MAAIIKTWPSFMPVKKVMEVFTHDWGRFYFTLGRGRPAKPIGELWYTHKGRILGFFRVSLVTQNAGQLPKLRSLSNFESEWQIKPDHFVAICDPPFHPLEERIYYSGFRGWRYFELKTYRGTFDAKVRL